MLLTYSTVTGVQDVAPVLVTEEWTVLAARLMVVAKVADKRAVGLFSGARYSSGRGVVANASLLILDFDNTREVQGQKQRLDHPVQFGEVAAKLQAQGVAFVAVTSFSHTMEWPRFRVVCPIDVPVPQEHWLRWAAQQLKALDLGPLLRGLDPCYRRPGQIYYWPAAPLGTDQEQVVYAEGNPLRFDPARIPAAPPPPPTRSGAAASQTLFTPEQVQHYYSTVCPDLNWGASADLDTDWKHPCPLHHGEKLRFYVRRDSGAWYCFSGCQSGGDIYKFHQRKYSVPFPVAREAVHKIMGISSSNGREPKSRASADEVEQAILALTPDAVTDAVTGDVIDLLRELPKRSRERLLELFAERNAHLNLDELRSELATQTRVVPLRAVPQPSVNDVPGDESDKYGLQLDTTRFHLDDRGVHGVKWVQRGEHGYYERVSPALTDRPIWPLRLGVDLVSESTYVELGWVGSAYRQHREWLPAEALTRKETLLALDDGPVSLDNVAGVAGFLRHAKTVTVEPLLEVATLPGWVNRDGYMHFVAPVQDDTAPIRYIGAPWETAGDVAAWGRGLALLASLKEAGFTALCALGLSAASPFVRLVSRRSGVLAIIAESSTGKNKVINFALSIWAKPELLRVPASSTVKGAQDVSIDKPDYPTFFDEVQQIAKDKTQSIENFLYFVGDKQRRVTSSRAQTVRGGEKMYGVSLLASEVDFVSGQQGGAQNRVISLHGNPLPHSDRLVHNLQACSDSNYGVVGLDLIQRINRDYAQYTADINALAEHYLSLGGVRGDDPFSVALVVKGLQLLEEVYDTDLHARHVGAWLAERIGGERSSTRDSVEATFIFLVESLMASGWGESGVKNVLRDADGYVAFREGEAVCPDHPLEIVYTSHRVQEILRARHQPTTVVRDWVRRGWVRPQSRNMMWSRPTSKAHGSGIKVWRVTKEGLAVSGWGPALEPLE